MAKKTKAELLEEAHNLGLSFDEDDHYNDILAAVRTETAAEEEEFVEEEFEDVMEPDPPEAISSPEPVAEPAPRRRHPWRFNELGHYVRR